MHYLHWETDRGRNRSANAVKEASKPQLPTTLAEVVDEATADERPSTTTDPNRPPTALDPTIKRRRGLARMLFHAAKLAEAMNSHSDERLISEYLHEDPALHPRRTLDQSYYGALFPTQTRDRDQVVYRATAPQYHRCVRENRLQKCARCQEDVQMAPRVIMVDQLWMWILDESMFASSPCVMRWRSTDLFDRYHHHCLPRTVGQKYARSLCSPPKHPNTIGHSAKWRSTIGF